MGIFLERNFTGSISAFASQLFAYQILLFYELVHKNASNRAVSGARTIFFILKGLV